MAFLSDLTKCYLKQGNLQKTYLEIYIGRKKMFNISSGGFVTSVKRLTVNSIIQRLPSNHFRGLRQVMAPYELTLKHMGLIIPLTFCKKKCPEKYFLQIGSKLTAALQMFTGNYRDSTGKSECRDKFTGIACIPAIPVILKSHTLSSIVIFAGNLILQGYYGDSPHQM